MKSELLRYFQTLLKSPGSSFVAVGVFTVGMVATSTVYGIIHAILSPPAGIQDVDRVVNIQMWGRDRLSQREFASLRERQRVFPLVAAWGPFRDQVTVGDETLSVSGEAIDGDYFRLLGVRMAEGRPLLPGDGLPNTEFAAVISFRLWESLFGRDPGVVGRAIRVSRMTYRVVGVTARDFRGLVGNGVLPTALWIPVRVVAERATADRSATERRWLRVIARMSEGQTPSVATVGLGVVAASLPEMPGRLTDSPIRPPTVVRNCRRSFRSRDRSDSDSTLGRRHDLGVRGVYGMYSERRRKSCL